MRNIVLTSFLTMAVGVVVGAAGVHDQVDILDRLKAAIDASSEAKSVAKEFIKNNLTDYCRNPVFIEEVLKNNATDISLDEIKNIDAQWQAAEEELAIMTEVLGNRCAEEARRLAGSSAAIVEVIVMDDQGALVGANAMTSDYWQGDEAKWLHSYNGGRGGVDIGDEKFDRSTNAVIQQFSLPIVTTAGEVIGAVTIGLDVSKL